MTSKLHDDNETCPMQAIAVTACAECKPADAATARPAVAQSCAAMMQQHTSIHCQAWLYTVRAFQYVIAMMIVF